MMNKAQLTEKDVKHVANLIKIYLAEDELQTFQNQLDTALDQVEVFDELDTQDTEITASSIGVINVFRADKVGEPQAGLTQEEATMNAQDVQDGYVVVQRVVNGD